MALGTQLNTCYTGDMTRVLAYSSYAFQPSVGHAENCKQVAVHVPVLGILGHKHYVLRVNLSERHELITVSRGIPHFSGYGAYDREAPSVHGANSGVPMHLQHDQRVLYYTFVL